MLMLPVAAVSGIFVTKVAVQKRQDENLSLISQLSPQPSTLQQQRLSSLQKTKSKLTGLIMNVDNRYQRFVQDRIDPLLGKKRHEQLQEILSEEALALSPKERYANRRLALGSLIVGMAIAGKTVLPALIPPAIMLGLLATSANYVLAYEQWKKTKRLGILHLICVYSAYMWLGGYLLVRAVSALLLGVVFKVQAISENKSRNNLVNIFQLQPDRVWVRSNGSEIEIPFEQLQINDTLVLHAGQIVPVDGTVISGAATLDQHMLTGESQPVEKAIGDPILASTMVISGQVDISVEKTSDQTTAGQIQDILNQTSQYNPSSALNIVDTLDRLAPPTLALCIGSLPFIGIPGSISLMGANSTIATYLSSNLAVLNFLNLAADNGILVKEGRALETLNKIDTVVFDKTGTLTLDQPHVAQVHVLNGLQEEDILTLAAAAEARQTHPIARAIMIAAEEKDLEYPALDEGHYEVGYGLRVRLADTSPTNDRFLKRLKKPEKKATRLTSVEDVDVNDYPLDDASPLIRVGSGRFMIMEGIELTEEVHALTAACQAKGNSLVMVAIDDELAGCLELQPTIRPEAAEIIEGLYKRGLDLYIISGDQEAPTRTLAEDLGMTGYFANTLPEAKADLVADLQAQGRKVCFIGDGINDAIALRKAEVSISLSGATTAATDTAQIILMQGNLDRLLYLFELSERFDNNLMSNLRFTAAVSVVAITGVLFGGFTFVVTESLYMLSMLGGLSISMKPLLGHQDE